MSSAMRGGQMIKPRVKPSEKAPRCRGLLVANSVAVWVLQPLQGFLVFWMILML